MSEWEPDKVDFTNMDVLGRPLRPKPDDNKDSHEEFKTTYEGLDKFAFEPCDDYTSICINTLMCRCGWSAEAHLDKQKGVQPSKSEDSRVPVELHGYEDSTVTSGYKYPCSTCGELSDILCDPVEFVAEHHHCFKSYRCTP